MDETEEMAGIDGVVLSPALLTALYGEVLVSPASPAADPEIRPGKAKKPGSAQHVLPPEPAKPEQPPQPVPAADAIRALGLNRRHICLLVSVPGREVLPARTRTFLEKMLAACQLTIDDLAIVNLSLSPASVTELAGRFTPEKWLLAGVSPASIGLEAADIPFEVIGWNNADILSLPPLATMEQDSPAAKLLKRQLWAGLQKLFGL